MSSDELRGLMRSYFTSLFPGRDTASLEQVICSQPWNVFDPLMEKEWILEMGKMAILAENKKARSDKKIDPIVRDIDDMIMALQKR